MPDRSIFAQNPAGSRAADRKHFKKHVEISGHTAGPDGQTAIEAAKYSRFRPSSRPFHADQRSV